MEHSVGGCMYVLWLVAKITPNCVCVANWEGWENSLLSFIELTLEAAPLVPRHNVMQHHTCLQACELRWKVGCFEKESLLCPRSLVGATSSQKKRKKKRKTNTKQKQNKVSLWAMKPRLSLGKTPGQRTFTSILVCVLIFPNNSKLLVPPK